MEISKSARSGSQSIVSASERAPFQKSGMLYHCFPAQRSTRSVAGLKVVKRLLWSLVSSCQILGASWLGFFLFLYSALCGGAYHRISSMLNPAFSTHRWNSPSMPPLSALRSSYVFSSLRSAQRPICFAVAATRKCGSGRKKTREEAAASRRMRWGGAELHAARRRRQVEESSLRSSMLARWCGRMARISGGRVSRVVLEATMDVVVLSQKKEGVFMSLVSGMVISDFGEVQVALKGNLQASTGDCGHNKASR